MSNEYTCDKTLTFASDCFPVTVNEPELRRSHGNEREEGSGLETCRDSTFSPSALLPSTGGGTTSRE
jgi:hypothetical protein